MDNLVVRPIALEDLNIIFDMDHSYHTDYVWQLDVQSTDREYNVRFREVRLPRSMRVEYPK
ncbi:MAG: hypothetical protein N2D54_01130 [Chloroflexota bacterium]